MKETESLVKKNIGFNIKTKRKQLGLTQAQLGKLIQIDQRQIAYIEGGNSMPSLKTLCKLTSVLNCPIYELFVYKPEINEKSQLIQSINTTIEASNIEELNLLNEILNVIRVYK